MDMGGEMNRILLALLALAFANVAAFGQSGKIGAGQVIGNPGASSDYARGTTLTSLMSNKGIIFAKDAPYNVKCNNSDDDTAAIQAAVTAAQVQFGAVVRLPIGICRTSAPIVISAKGVTLEGVSQYSTIIATSSGTTDVVQVYNATPFFGAIVRNMKLMSTAVSPSAGAGVAMDNTGVVTFEDLNITGTYDGVRINQVAQGAGEVNRVNVSNVAHDSFAVWSTNTLVITDCTTYQASGPGNAGFHLINGAGIRISKSNSSLHNYGLLVDPGNGQDVVDVWMSDIDLDASKAVGFQVSPGGTGLARNMFFSNVRAGFSNNGSFTAGDGMVIGGAGLKEMTFIGGEIVKNTNYGINITGGTGIHFVGTNVLGNSVSGSAGYPGVNISGGDRISFIGGSATIFTDGLANSAYQSYGMTIQSSFTGELSVRDMVMTGNVSGEFINASTAATIDGFSTSTVAAMGGAPSTGFWFTASAPKARSEIDISSSATTVNTATPALVLTNVNDTASNLVPFVFADKNTAGTKTGIAALVAKTYTRGSGLQAGSLDIYTSTVAGAALATHIDYNQHTLMGGTVAPTIASGACGATTNGAVVAGSNDQAMNVTIGAAATTDCAITFAGTWETAPRACMLTPANAGAADWATTDAYVSAISATTLTITGTALANANYAIHCY
jgi:hypothetical protein